MIFMQVISLGYLKNGPICFTKLPDSGTKESNRLLGGLDTAVIISDTNEQELLPLIDLEIKQVNKKKEKVERRR